MIMRSDKAFPAVNPLVSVIVPVYQAQEYLASCIQSVLSQSFRDFELLLVDDGSTDRSGAICEDFAKTDARARVFHQANAGVSAARNYGIEHARGEYLLFVDSDDEIHPELLERTIGIAQKHKSELVIFGYSPDRELLSQRRVWQEFDLTPREALKEMFLGVRFRGLSWNKLYKKELFASLRYPEDRSVGEDTLVTYSVLKQASGIRYTEEVLYFYRRHPQSIVHRTFHEKRMMIFASMDAISQDIRQSMPELRRECDTFYFTRYFDDLAAFMKELVELDPVQQRLTDRFRQIGKRKIRDFLLTKSRWRMKGWCVLFLLSPSLFRRLSARWM